MPETRVGQSGTGGVNANIVFAGFFIAYGSSFQFGYNHGLLNQPSKHINTFYNETYTERNNGVPLDPMHITVLWSLTTAVMYLPGGIVGAFMGAWLADTVGRKWSLLVSQVFIVIGAILSVICVPAKLPELLMVARIFVGIQSGMANGIAPMYLQEIVQPNLRGAFGTLHQLALAVGILVGTIFGLPQLLGTESRWQYLMFLEMAPVIASCSCLPFIHESPRFLMLIRKDALGARASLEFYRKSKEVDAELNEMEVEGRAMEALHQRTIRQMFESDIRKAMIICCMFQVMKQFSGINAIFFYSRSIYANAGVTETDIPYAIIGTSTIRLVQTIGVVPLMKVTGRRKLLLYPMIPMIVLLICLTICLHFQEDHPIIAYISVVCILLYVFAFGFGLGPIPWIVGSELFRQDARSKAMAAGAIINPLLTFIIALGFEPVQKVLHYYTFIIFIGCLCFSFAFIYFLVPETKDRTFDEVAAELSGDRNRGGGRKVAPAEEGLHMAPEEGLHVAPKEELQTKLSEPSVRA